MLAAKTPTRLRVAGVAGITIGGIYIAGALSEPPLSLAVPAGAVRPCWRPYCTAILQLRLVVVRCVRARVSPSCTGACPAERATDATVRKYQFWGRRERPSEQKPHWKGVWTTGRVQPCGQSAKTPGLDEVAPNTLPSLL